MKIVAIAICSILVIAGVVFGGVIYASEQRALSMLRSFKGMTEADIIKEFGPPDQSFLVKPKPISKPLPIRGMRYILPFNEVFFAVNVDSGKCYAAYGVKTFGEKAILKP